MGYRGVLGLKLFTITELLDNIIIKMLSDLLIGHNWPINGHFLSHLPKKSTIQDIWVNQLIFLVNLTKNGHYRPIMANQ